VKTYFRRVFVFFLTLTLVAAPQGFSPTPEMYRALAGISPDSLRGNLSFIASDLLEGRDTPSRGLDIAAEYIAAQFRRARLEPAGDDGYFQTAGMVRLMPAPDGFELRVREGSRTFTVPKDHVCVVSHSALDLSGTPVSKVTDAADLKPESIRGKVVLLDAARRDLQAVAKGATALQPAAFLETASENTLAPRVADADEERATFGDVPLLIVRDAQTVRGFEEAQAGLTVSIKLPVPAFVQVKVRNVIGLLRGSDPVLRDRYVLLTAHYDHIGRNGAGQVFPGANDDGSGTVSVMEIGKALAAMPVHPKRSIVFMTFFGEEEGSLGASYYVRHPVFPLEKTVADLNLEQVGRTDSSAGREVSNASLTGFNYSDVARTLREAGKFTGVKVYETADGDDFFDRSDNATFAEHGIPAHTLVVAFEYPDYHAAGDVWPKIDYDNMAKVDRMIALGTVMLADNPEAPKWNRGNPKAAAYLKAR